MFRYIVVRLGLAVLVVAGVICLTFVIARVIPGDPAVSWTGSRATAAELEAVRRSLGLDQPLLVQLGRYFKGVVTGDWGIALHTHRPVLSDLRRALPATLELVVSAVVMGVVAGVPLGLISARWQGKWVDQFVRITSVLAVSLPVFWMALILQEVFAQRANILPVAGIYAADIHFTHPLATYTGIPVIDALITGNWSAAGSSITHLILPALIVAVYPMGVVTRLVRAKVLDVVGEPHTQMVRALGYSERSVLGRFALRLSWAPVAQVVALVFAYALVNTFLVEAIFNWPGLGSYAAASIISLDTPAIVGITLLVAVVYVTGNLAVDVIQAMLDPRIRLR